MKEIRYPTLGETWLATLREVYCAGESVDNDMREFLHLAVSFETGAFEEDPLLVRFGSRGYVEEMRKVFFSDEANQFGHSYRDRLRGPRGRHDLSDIIELLRHSPMSKRAVVTLVGPGDGTVPCINTIHFLRRREGLVASYFSRGQDIFHKFYADGACLFEMADRVASSLEIPLLGISGFISSAHVYQKDFAEIGELLDKVELLPAATSLHVGME
jgi:thymidylate synthase